MRQSFSVSLPVDTATVHPWVADLARYPAWMPLVHSVETLSDHTWAVELRAKVGVFARSKRLTMRRTDDDGRRIVFSRDEPDGRAHSPWLMTVVAEPTGDGGCVVSVDLEYGGSLWTAGVLDRILAAQVDAGKEGLARVVQGA